MYFGKYEERNIL